MKLSENSVILQKSKNKENRYSKKAGDGQMMQALRE